MHSGGGAGMSSVLYVQFGPVQAEIVIESSLDQVGVALEKWLAIDRGKPERVSDIVFTLNSTTTDIKSDGGPSRLFAGDGWAEKTEFGCWDGRGWETIISRNDSGALLWTCSRRDGVVLSLARRLPSIALRLAHEHYFSYQEMLASTFVYRQLIPGIQVALLDRGATLIHASSIHDASGMAVLVAGWGGSGKTSASSYLYMNQPECWKYLSDDLAILGKDGIIHFSPIPINVFPYNVHQFPVLEKQIVGAMGIVERWQWRLRRRLFGFDGVARRVAPVRDIEPNKKFRLGLALHLQRTNSAVPRITECGVEDLAKVAKNVLSYELRHGLNAYTLANAFYTAATPIIPGPDEIANRAQRIMESAFAHVRLACIDVPKSYGPMQVSGLVADIAQGADLGARGN